MKIEIEFRDEDFRKILEAKFSESVSAYGAWRIENMVKNSFDRLMRDEVDRQVAEILKNENSIREAVLARFKFKINKAVAKAITETIVKGPAK